MDSQSLVEKFKAAAQNSPPSMALIISHFVLFVVALVINALAGLQGTIDTGIFTQPTANVSATYTLAITPAGWTFAIWGVIYTYMIIWMIYSLTLLCTKTENGYLYCCPALLPPTFFMSYMVNLVFNMSWLILFDREMLWWALLAAFIMPLTAYTSIFISMKSVSEHSEELIRQGLRKQILYVIGMVQNGIGMYAAWLTVAFVLNLCMVLIYYLGNDNMVASSWGLGILAFFVVFYAWLDLIKFENSFRYIYTPYMVWIWALYGIIYENWDPSAPISTYMAALIAIVAFLFIVKIWQSIKKSKEEPLYKDPADGEEKDTKNYQSISP